MMKHQDTMNEYQMIEYLSESFWGRLGEGFRIERAAFFFVNVPHFSMGDLVILFQDEPIALVEVKRGPLSESDLQLVLNQCGRLLYDFKIRFFILYDGGEFFFMDRTGSDQLTRSSFSRIISVLKGRSGIKYSLPSEKAVIQKLISFIPTGLPQSGELVDFFRSLREGAIIEDKEDIGRLIFAEEDDEKSFMKILLNTGPIHQVCRYTTLSSTFRLLEGPKQNMCSIVCMNDRSENYYADSRVRYPISGTAQCNENNDTFIISCVDMGMFDNLTMWRLYGDDSKGSNLVYGVRATYMSDFYLGRVSYEREDGTHPELDFIDKLFNQKLNRGYRFKLRHWNIWKHFFKSHYFSIECEVRLLYLKNNSENGFTKEIKWIENPDNKIVSKMALFPIEDSFSFPLVLQRIVLGPNVPEKEALIVQYDYMAKQQLKSPVIVLPSMINVYRK